MTLTEVVDPSNRDATQWCVLRRLLLVALFCLSAWADSRSRGRFLVGRRQRPQPVPHCI